MNLEQAQEFAKNEMEKAPVVVVTSDKAVYLLQKDEEISVIKAHADLNKLEMFVLKCKGDVVEEKTEESKPSEEPKVEAKPKKKK